MWTSKKDLLIEALADRDVHFGDLAIRAVQLGTKWKEFSSYLWTLLFIYTEFIFCILRKITRVGCIMLIHFNFFIFSVEVYFKDFTIVMCFYFFATEHMLFFASEKYPVEDSYDKYITEVL